MRPAMRRARKKKVRTPGGRFSYHRLSSPKKAFCGVCHRPLLGSRRSRAHPELCVPCSRAIMREKVRVYAQKE